MTARTEKKLFDGGVNQSSIESDEKYRSLVENSGIPITIFDRQGRIVFINNVGAKKLGGTSTELVGKTLPDLFPPQTARLFLRRFHKVIDSGRTVQYEDQVEIATGKRWFLSILHPVQDSRGETYGVQIVSHDITDRKRAEEALRESEERYRRLVQFSPDAIVIHSEEQITFINNVGLTLLGASSPDQVIGKSVMDFVHPDYRKIVQKRVAQVIERRKEAPLIQEKFIKLDGTAFDVEVAAIPFTYLDKPAVQVVVRDITKRKDAEEALKESEARYHAIFNEARDGIVLIDSESGQIVDGNPEFERQTGRELEQLRTMKIWELRPPEKVEAAKRIFFEIQETGVGGSADLEFQMPDGRIVPIEFASRRITIQGRPYNQSIVRDITDRKQADQRLERSRQQLRNLSRHLQSVREEERSRIAREIHDELGQELTGLKMDLAWIEQHLPPELEAMLERTASMADLIDQTIESVRRISAALRPGILDDLGIAAAIEWEAQEFANRTGITCHVSSNPSDMTLDQDRSTTIFRIFQETLTNVARHANASQINVRLNQKPDGVTLEVKDNGKGISEDQVFNSKSLGLLGMRERVNVWGGTLEIKGARDEGTTVTVWISNGHHAGD